MERKQTISVNSVFRFKSHSPHDENRAIMNVCDLFKTQSAAVKYNVSVSGRIKILHVPRMGNKTFLISRAHIQPIKQLEFHGALYKVVYLYI